MSYFLQLQKRVDFDELNSRCGMPVMNGSL
jgi:hypothetical protein